MKKICVFITLVGLASCAFDLKLNPSIERIQVQIQDTKDNPPDWSVVPGIIKDALECLGSLIPFLQGDPRLPESVNKYFESKSAKAIAADLLKVDWEGLSSKRSKRAADDAWEGWKEFMKTQKFEKIHDHIWKSANSGALKNILNYIESAGYPDIYVDIKKFYSDMERPDLGDQITKTVTSVPQVKQQRSAPMSTLNEFPFVKLNTKAILAPDCSDIIGFFQGIVTKLNDSNIPRVFKVFMYTFQEVLGSPAVHVLMIKIGEPATGALLHDLFVMPEMDEFVPLLQTLILSDSGVAQINNIIQGAVGLTLENTTLFTYIINIVQYLVWGYPFP